MLDLEHHDWQTAMICGLTGLFGHFDLLHRQAWRASPSVSLWVGTGVHWCDGNVIFRDNDQHIGAMWKDGV